MKFFNTTLKNGKRIVIALDHVENVHEDENGDAIFVMLPANGGQRIFETRTSYDDASNHLLILN